MSIPTAATWQTTNWPACHEALKRRGSLTIWFDPEMIWDALPTGGRGRRQSYSVRALPLDLKEVVVLANFMGMSYREAAEVCRCQLEQCRAAFFAPGSG